MVAVKKIGERVFSHVTKQVFEEFIKNKLTS